MTDKANDTLLPGDGQSNRPNAVAEVITGTAGLPERTTAHHDDDGAQNNDSINDSINDNDNAEVNTTDDGDSQDEDTILFGSLTTSLADMLSDEVDTYLNEGVASLPMLASAADRKELFLGMLRKRYMRKVDVWEMYLARNVFSVTMYPPRRRRAIVTAYLEHDADARDAAKDNSAATPGVQRSDEAAANGLDGDGQHGGDQRDARKSEFVYPQKEQVPSQDEMDQVEDEMAELRAKIKAARLRRDELLVQQKSAELGEQTSATTLKLLKDVDTDRLKETIAEGNASVRDLQGLVQDAKVVQQELDDKKMGRKDDEMHTQDDAEMADALRDPAPSQKRLSLEDQYEQDRGAVESNVDDVLALKALLVAKKQKT